MEYIDGGSLHEFLFSEKIPKMSLELGLCIVQQLTSGLDYLHSYKEDIVLCHGDLKPSNVLLTLAFVVKLADFGSTNVHDAEGNRGGSVMFKSVKIQESSQYTLSHVAPEFLKHVYGPRFPSMDIYSLSMIIYEIFTRKPVYHGARQLPLYTNLLEGKLRPDIHVLDEIEKQHDNQTLLGFLKHTMTQCWDCNPQKRPTSKEICKQATDHLKLCNGLEIHHEWKLLSKRLGRKPLPYLPNDATVDLTHFDRDFIGAKVTESPHKDDVLTASTEKPRLPVSTQVPGSSTVKEDRQPTSLQKGCSFVDHLTKSCDKVIEMVNANVDDETVDRKCTNILERMKNKLPTRNQFPLMIKCIEIASSLKSRSMFSLSIEFLKISANLYKLLRVGSNEQQYCLGKMSATCRNLADDMGKEFQDDDVRDNILPLLVGALYEVRNGTIDPAEKINTCHNILKHFIHVCNSIHDYTHAKEAAKICQSTLLTTMSSPVKPNKIQRGQFCDCIGDVYFKLKNNPQALAMYRQAMDNLISSPSWTNTAKNQDQYIASIQDKIENLDLGDEVFEPETEDTVHTSSVIHL
uniref:CBL-interacting protein kinase 33-like n=1 Tax=Phallusia mammillata TaxID=59560 RepID=A0A6F9DKW7_9ASCI|nr:CBL-interacting protein kinase 33-like [Phallusia mammillata]